jgi:NADPH2:quinone reductase
MKAVVIREPGGPEVLELRDVADPDVVHGHVRVKVAYAGVNRADLLQRAGFYPAPPGVPKDVPGLEYAGTVEAVGAGVTRFSPGARVYGLVAGGAYAEKVVVHEREAVPIPDGISDELAAAVPEAFVTAWDALVVQAGLSAGESLLVHAAGSGVGSAGVQIGRALGCTVLGTSRHAEKLERARELGLDEGIVPDQGSFAAAVRAKTGGRGVDVVLDLVGGAYFPEELEACAPRARVVVVGLTAGRKASIDLGLLLQRRLHVVGTVLRARPLEEKIAAAQLLERSIGPLLAKRRLAPVVDRVFSLAQAADAHALVASDATFGKVLLRA